jgi:hypothetical protein
MERRKDETVSALMEHANDTKPLNATEKRIRVDIPPVLLDLIPITKLNRINHEKDQLSELGARRLECNNLTWKSRWLILEKDELVRWKQRNPGKNENEFHKGFFIIEARIQQKQIRGAHRCLHYTLSDRFAFLHFLRHYSAIQCERW